MAIGETLSSLLRISRWRKTRRQNKRPRSVDVTDIIRSIDGIETYHSFDIDYQIEATPKRRQPSRKSQKTENRKSWMSFMCGMENVDFEHSDDIKPRFNQSEDSETTASIKEKTPVKSNKSENRKSWMSLLLCGTKFLDFENQFETQPELFETLVELDDNCQSTEREDIKSLLSPDSDSKSHENSSRKSANRDSGISFLSDECTIPNKKLRNKFRSKSCDDLLDSLCHHEETCEKLPSNNSMNNLFRTTSIQENSLRLMRKRHRNVKRRRGNVCDSCYSSSDFQVLAGSKSESDLTRGDSIVEREVRFVGVSEDTEKQEKSVSSTEVNRTNSLQLKSWQIRRQRRDQKNKEKRESRNLELLLSKDFEFQERLIM